VAPWLVGAATPAGRYVQTACANGGAASFQRNDRISQKAREEVTPSMMNRLISTSNNAGIIWNITSQREDQVFFHSDKNEVDHEPDPDLALLP
jgi:hypothetical protein